MLTKQTVKKEIDKIPDCLLEDILQFLTALKKKNPKKKIHTFKLKGQFDKMNIRDRAYE